MMRAVFSKASLRSLPRASSGQTEGSSVRMPGSHGMIMIPQYLDLRRVSLKNAVYSGSLPGDACDGEKPASGAFAHAFPYLAEAVSGVEQISAELAFSTHPSGTRVITGNIRALFHAQCQRCLDDAPLYVDRKVSIACVFDESDMNALSDDYEPWLLNPDDKLLDIYSVLQEEFLLALPNAVYHNKALLEALREHPQNLPGLPQPMLATWEQALARCQAIDLATIGMPSKREMANYATKQVSNQQSAEQGTTASKDQSRPAELSKTKSSWQQGDQNPFSVLDQLKK